MKTEEPKELYVEIVLERFLGRVVRSTLRKANQEEIEEAKQRYETTGECSHNLIDDEPNFMYHFRYCGTCGVFLDLI